MNISSTWSQLTAVIVGALAIAAPSVIKIVTVVVRRLVDRYIPDPEGKHPLPPVETKDDPPPKEQS
jgi:hypothetical protein